MLKARYWLVCDGPKVVTADGGRCWEDTDPEKDAVKLVEKYAAKGWLIRRNKTGEITETLCPHCVAWIKSLKSEGGAK